MELEVLLNRFKQVESRLKAVEERVNREITGWEDTDNTKRTVGWKGTDVKKKTNEQRGYTGW